MEQNNLSKKNSSVFKIISATLVVIALAGGTIFFINNRKEFFRQSDKAGNESLVISGILSQSDLQKDFENKTLITRSTPPATDYAINQFQPYIEKSLQAIKDNKPSRPENTSLLPDYLNIAVDYVILGQYDKSEDYYKKALQQWPDDYKTNVGLGDLYILMAQYQSAALKYYEVINLYPKEANTYAKLADIYFKYSNNQARADEIYELGIKNADSKEVALDAYIVFLSNYKRDAAKLEEVQKQYGKITGSAIEQQRQQIERSLELK